jgi:hypothetical protein
MQQFFTTPTTINWSSINTVKEDEMGGACSTNGVEEECIQDICGKARRKETTGKTTT